MNDWISVKDKQPESNGHYEVLVNGEVMPPEDQELNPVHFDVLQGWMYDWYSTARYKVTHWKEP